MDDATRTSVEPESVKMAQLSDQDRATLLKAARTAIAVSLGAADGKAAPKTDVSPVLMEKSGCFVTLHKRGMLRGCIGTLEPTQTLLQGVQENARNAAFHDPRFPELTVEELSQVDIEISRLTVPEPLLFDSPEDLLNRLKPGVHGVILAKGWHRATFLPQVWEQLPDKRSFMEHLCRKAGMGGNCWKEKDLVIKVYEVEHFSESRK
jgi:AmmeMemoRadiSam system protein A